MPIQLHDEIQQKFLNDICREYGKNTGLNSEADALFSAIQTAFVAGHQSRGAPVIDDALIPHLAACAWVALDYDKNQHIPLDKSDHDFIFQKTLRGFMWTIGRSIKADSKWIGPNDTAPGLFFGCFKIPSWFVMHVRNSLGYC